MATQAGMTPGEVKVVQTTWKIVMENSTEHAASLLLKWWEKDPSVLHVFPRYNGKSLDELRKMPRIRSHGTHIFGRLDGIIHNLNDEPVVHELMLDMKRDHTKTKENATAKDYGIFVEVAAGYLTEKLGSHMTPEAASGYTKLLTYVGKEGGIFH
jgi:hypothetical protein